MESHATTTDSLLSVEEHVEHDFIVLVLNESGHVENVPHEIQQTAHCRGFRWSLSGIFAQ